MIVGIPKGLLFYKYYPFYINFFQNLGAEVIISPDTNKDILNKGIASCIDEACVSVKVFHGHCEYLKDKCDVLFIPRIMKIDKGEFICPKFCGLVEMVINSIDNLPQVIDEPIYADSYGHLKKWAINVGRIFTKNPIKIKKSLDYALSVQQTHNLCRNDKGYLLKVAVVGHPYNIFDKYINMNLLNKLNKLGIGVITEDAIDNLIIENQTKILYKKPFWTFAKYSYGFTTYVCNKGLVDGVVYLSSFSCGIDSVVIELIKNHIKEVPFLELKLDEQTGEAGLDTRLEAFFDMLVRKKKYKKEMA